jgi:hypothetical protein
VVDMDLLDDESLIDLRRRAKATDPAAVLAEERRLRAGAPAGPAKPAPAAAAGAVPTASADGLCALCLTRPARGTCAMCGRAACAADLWVMLRLCRSCANERDVERGQRPAKPEPGNWLAGERKPEGTT